MQKSSFEGYFGRVQDPEECIFQALREPKIQNFGNHGAISEVYWVYYKPPVLGSWNACKRYTFHHLIKSIPFLGTRALLKYYNCLMYGVSKFSAIIFLFRCDFNLL